MHDLWRILEASSRLGSEPVALATITRTHGSTYRRAGTRMLITSGGRAIGAVSGGCLEAEIAARGRDVIRSGEPCLLSFDTRLTHGCHGFLEVLVERIAAADSSHDVLGMVARRMVARETALIASICRTTGDGAPGLGSYGLEAGKDLPWEVREDAFGALAAGRSVRRTYEWGECFFDVIQPPIRLVIVGGGHDVVPLEKLGRTLGWDVQVVAPAGQRNLEAPLAEVGAVQVLSPAALAAALRPDSFTAVILMTHHFGRDLAFLDALLPLEIPYLGLLGPRKRREQIIAELASSSSAFDMMKLRNLRSPIGLDLGGESPEEIALSIAAEIRAVLAHRTAKPLRECKGPIHPSASASANPRVAA